MSNKAKDFQKKIYKYYLIFLAQLRSAYKKLILGKADQENSPIDVETLAGNSSNVTTLLNTQVQAAKSSIKAKKSHSLVMKCLFGIGVLVLLFLIYYSSKQEDSNKQNEEFKAPLKVEVASQALDIDKMWRNHFEDKLIQSKTKVDEKLQFIEDTINDYSAAHQNQLKKEIETLNAKIKYLTDEQFSTKTEVSEIKLKSKAAEAVDQAHSEQVMGSNVIVNDMGRGEIFDRPKSSRNYIPETAYVKGVLLGGISVSTALGSSSEPVPVIIRITGSGNLPKNFNMDLTNCQIMGSSYGDLSSERAIIRAEVLSCKDLKQELIYTTKIAGLIYGDDGMNGIKGKVVQTSGKHLNNAMLGSMISGFAGSAKGQDQFTVTGFGAIDTQKKNMSTMMQQGALNGASNAAERLAEYYIKQAEAMSPVLMVSGGVKVDVVFTKGVYLGALDIQEKLEQARKGKGDRK